MKSDKKKWVRLFLFLIPVLVLFTGVNYLADPGNIFHDFSGELGNAMMEGKTVQVLSNNLDERKVAQYMIENMQGEVDTMVWGASVAMCVDSEMVGTNSYYNMAVSAGDYYDLLAFFGLLDINGKYPKRIILNIDTRLFDKAIYHGDGRHDRLMDYSEYMLRILEGKEPEEIPEVAESGNGWTKLSQLFSVTYFQWSVEYIKSEGPEVLFSKRWIPVEKDSAVARYLPDYSMVYSDAMEAVTLESVKHYCDTYWMENSVSEYASLTEENKEIFERLILHLQSKGIEVELFMTPYAPYLWDRVHENQYPMIYELEEYSQYLAEEYGLKVQGSFNPYKIEMTNEDFYDARHVKKGVLKEKYDFKKSSVK